MENNSMDIQDNSNKKGSFTFLKEVNYNIGNKFFYEEFMDEPEKNKKEEENIFSYECMKEFINDNWSEFFRLNIENVIKQYENKEWTKTEEKLSSISEDFNNDKEKDLNALRDGSLDNPKDNIEILNPFYSENNDNKSVENIYNDLSKDINNTNNKNINEKEEEIIDKMKIVENKEMNRGENEEKKEEVNKEENKNDNKKVNENDNKKNKEDSCCHYCL